ncbi:MAG: 6-carboxytetrahydropterin synthase [Myxococcales bacterium]|nr:6-carboxytetrahydropterin synthase [Myxococcales bacterium]
MIDTENEVNAPTYRSSKTFHDFPCAHRRWRHEGHCAHVHGYSRGFRIWFGSHERTENGFVVDFGGLKVVKSWLTEHFDHTLLLDADDPLLQSFRALERLGACRIVTYEDVGMEGTAKFIYDWLDPWIREQTGGRAWVVSIEVFENEKNSAIYIAPEERSEGMKTRLAEA